MKIKELKSKSVKDLEALLVEKRGALRSFRFSVSGSNARNVREGRAIRRDIARILTLINKK